MEADYSDFYVLPLLLRKLKFSNVSFLFLLFLLTDDLIAGEPAMEQQRGFTFNTSLHASKQRVGRNMLMTVLFSIIYQDLLSRMQGPYHDSCTQIRARFYATLINEGLGVLCTFLLDHV